MRVGLSESDGNRLVEQGTEQAKKLLLAHEMQYIKIAVALQKNHGILCGSDLQNLLQPVPNNGISSPASLKTGVQPASTKRRKISDKDRLDFRVSRDKIGQIHQLGRQQNIDVTGPTLFVNPFAGDPVKREVPPDMWHKVSDSTARPRVIICTIDELDKGGIQLRRSVREKFLRGEPILVDMSAYSFPNKSAERGGREQSLQEVKMQRVLQVTTHTVIERNRLLRLVCGDLSNEYEIQQQRSIVGQTLTKLFPQIGRDDDVDNAPLARLTTLQDRSRKVLAVLHPSAEETSDGASLSTRLKRWAGQFREKPKQKLIPAEIAFQEALLSSLLKCEQRMEKLDQALVETGHRWRNLVKKLIPRCQASCRVT